MYKELETERLSIRPIQVSDAAFINSLVNSEGWLQYIGDRHINGIPDSEKYIQKIRAHQQFFYSVFELKSTGQPIGIVTFLKRETKEFPDIGFALLPEFEKQGYALEACRKYLEEILQTNAYENITGITVSDNVKSVNLLKKLGLQYAFDYEENNANLSLFSLKPIQNQSLKPLPANAIQ